jgi:hypothetical protein
LHGADSPRLQSDLQVQIEIGRIHAHEEIGRIREQPLAQLAPDGHDFDIVTQYLHIAHDRQLFHGKEGLHTGLHHARASDAVKVGAGIKAPQGLDKRGRQGIPGGLARRDRDAQSRAAGRHEKD